MNSIEKFQQQANEAANKAALDIFISMIPHQLGTLFKLNNNYHTYSHGTFYSEYVPIKDLVKDYKLTVVVIDGKIIMRLLIKDDSNPCVATLLSFEEILPTYYKWYNNGFEEK